MPSGDFLVFERRLYAFVDFSDMKHILLRHLVLTNLEMQLNDCHFDAIIELLYGEGTCIYTAALRRLFITSAVVGHSNQSGRYSFTEWTDIEEYRDSARKNVNFAADAIGELARQLRRSSDRVEGQSRSTSKFQHELPPTLDSIGEKAF
jgi:hypothetical protein